MTGEPDLISLLYRADWTRLSLAAELSDGSSLLLAPGRRYRRQAGDEARGCDGIHPWEPVEEEMAGETVQWITGIDAPLGALLCPAWLLTSSRLDVLGPVRACGRDAWRVAMTRRPSIRDRYFSPAHLRTDRAEVIVDAELGILLRLEWLADDEPEAAEDSEPEAARRDGPWSGAIGEDDDDDDDDEPAVTEFLSLDLDPVIDPAQFAAPPGSRIGKSLGETVSGGGAAGWAWRTAGGLAAGGLGMLIKYGQHRAGAPGGPELEAAIPLADPAPELSSDGWPAGPPVGAEVLQLLHQSGSAPFAATLHEWLDLSAMVAQVPAGAQRAGFGGLGRLVGAIAGEPTTGHSISALRVAGPDRYRLDHADEPKSGPKTVICDGEHRWQVYGDKVTVGPAAALPGEIADLADASWLLACRLSGGELVRVDDRPAYRVRLTRGDAQWSPSLMWSSAAVAVVDAELGILIRLTTYGAGRAVRRLDLRDVAAGAGDIRADLPPGAPVAGEAGPFRRSGPGGDPLAGRNILADLAGGIGRQVAKEAAGAVRDLWRRLDGR
jgi:hypothetical protein